MRHIRNLRQVLFGGSWNSVAGIPPLQKPANASSTESTELVFKETEKLCGIRFRVHPLEWYVLLERNEEVTRGLRTITKSFLIFSLIIKKKHDGIKVGGCKGCKGC
jgi:hypothetical protein